MASINILKLQLHSCLSAGEVPECLRPGSALLSSLRQKVVELATNEGVVGTLQTSAQKCLQEAWVILMPGADERYEL